MWSAGCQHRPLCHNADRCVSHDMTCCGCCGTRCGTSCDTGCGIGRGSSCGTGCGTGCGSNTVAVRSMAHRSSARRVISRPDAEPMIVYSDEPLEAEVISSEGLPWVESTPRTTIEPRTIVEPQPQLQLPAGAVPQEVPLPPLTFPDARSNLHPSQFGDVVVIRDLPGDAMPPLRPTVTAPEAVPVVLPNGDQLIELSSKTISLGAGDNYRSLTGEVQQ